jgi:hypothetical protein
MILYSELTCLFYYKYNFIKLNKTCVSMKIMNKKSGVKNNNNKYTRNNKLPKLLNKLMHHNKCILSFIFRV